MPGKNKLKTLLEALANFVSIHESNLHVTIFSVAAYTSYLFKPVNN